jgi:hypothetical protein
VEVNPEVRFTAEARREPISQLVMVSGMATSSQSSGTLDGLNGHFFSNPTAEEAIIQGDLAKRLVDVGQAPNSLMGQEITLRFAQRQALPPPSQQAPADAPNQAVGPDEEAMGFSIAIYPAVGFLSAGEALHRAYADLQKNGTTTNAVPMYSFAEFNKLIGFEDVWEFERRYAESE